MQKVDGSELILGDAIRPAEIVGKSAFGGIFLFALVAEVAKYAINLLLGENAVRCHVDLSSGFAFSLPC
jgi:hypothetical protein